MSIYKSGFNKKNLQVLRQELEAVLANAGIEGISLDLGNGRFNEAEDEASDPSVCKKSYENTLDDDDDDDSVLALLQGDAIGCDWWKYTPEPASMHHFVISFLPPFSMKLRSSGKFTFRGQSH